MDNRLEEYNFKVQDLNDYMTVMENEQNRANKIAFIEVLAAFIFLGIWSVMAFGINAYVLNVPYWSDENHGWILVLLIVPVIIAVFAGIVVHAHLLDKQIEINAEEHFAQTDEEYESKN